jgi:hypothetical protein
MAIPFQRSTMIPTLACLATAMVFSLSAVGDAQSRGTDARLSFFVTSRNLGAAANLGGLEGADAHCQTLANVVGAGRRQWRAYLSGRSKTTQKVVHARDRIGRGPWFNVQGVEIAANVADLHSARNRIAPRTALTEQGNVVPRERHDMLTGSTPDGTLSTVAADTTCRNWTSSTAGSAIVGHHDKLGGPTTWNSAHLTQGCSAMQLRGDNGDALFYCFAAD